MNPSREDITSEEGIRLARRRRLEADVVLRDPWGHGEVALRCRDVSVSGLFVYSNACVEAGSEFVCAIQLDDTTVEATGRVTRVVLDGSAPNKSGMGIEFTALAREAHEWLMRFTTPRETAFGV